MTDNTYSNFMRWSMLETLPTPLAPNSDYMYELPILTHTMYLGGKRLSDEDFNELTQLMELAFNRGWEMSRHETLNEIEKSNEK